MEKQIEKIFEDEYILTINKPSGLIVHSDGRTEEPSLVDWLAKKYPNLENIGNPHTLDSGRYFKRWGIVNRLDRDTSGLILIAKDIDTFLNLQKQFLDRIILKKYIAKVWGNLNIEKLIEEKKIVQIKNENRFKINQPISRHKKDPRIWVSGNDVGERRTQREAETDFEILETENDITKIALYPITGRTHQLRLHTRFIGHPIIGDEKYGVNGLANEQSIVQIKNFLEDMKLIEKDKLQKLQLRAVGLIFKHPSTNKEIVLDIE